ncbi:hypothetical protein L873DRAFT_708687 [Choiromyces venosus 120613-1]|uniref:Uncharacterized protein n=1 Tax=Choiromyces venosus 120613-1 TaxID=1336337 RepID=A0A3N4ITB9_9PEZI|nr:hypothetical protein L873DRAFT_708687 [Choiromyces venosus 120613-1]
MKIKIEKAQLFLSLRPPGAKKQGDLELDVIPTLLWMSPPQKKKKNSVVKLHGFPIDDLPTPYSPMLELKPHDFDRSYTPASPFLIPKKKKKIDIKNGIKNSITDRSCRGIKVVEIALVAGVNIAVWMFAGCLGHAYRMSRWFKTLPARKSH